MSPALAWPDRSFQLAPPFALTASWTRTPLAVAPPWLATLALRVRSYCGHLPWSGFLSQGLASAVVWPSPVTIRSGRVDVGVGVLVAVRVGVAVAVPVLVALGVRVGVAVGVAVLLGLDV